MARVGWGCLIVLIAFALVRSAHAATVRVRYHVDARHYFETSPRATRSLLLELYSSKPCVGSALKQEFVQVEAVPMAPARPRRQTKHAVRQPAALTLETDVALETPPPALYLRVTGPGVKPVGDDCQRQATEVAAREARRPLPCPRDAVPFDGLCVDRYEASLWEIPDARVDLIRKVIDGTATLTDLTGPGVRQVGFPGAPFGHAAVPGSFLPGGAYTTPIYAASIPGVLPSTLVSAYQAWAACGYSGKRLLTSAEWSAAAAGTPAGNRHDGANDCNTGAGILPANAPVKTGSRSRCVSSAGAFDMVGNVSEWTMDGYGTTRYRGGAWEAGDEAGISFTWLDYPLTQDNAVGLRCVR